MNGISRSRGWDREIPHGVLPMEKLVLSDKWVRYCFGILSVFPPVLTKWVDMTLFLVQNSFLWQNGFVWLATI